MQMTRREFLGSAAVACLVPTAWGQSGKRDLTPPRIIYYNNFASHLLCAFNPNMYYPELPYRWSDENWRRPITSPPGGGILTAPARASSGPASRKEARMRRQRSGLRSVSTISRA